MIFFILKSAEKKLFDPLKVTTRMTATNLEHEIVFYFYQ